MYDYIELYSDPHYSSYLDIEEFHKLFSNRSDCTCRSNASYAWMIGEFTIDIRGIRCDRNGNYAFDDASVFKSINLIEVNLPQDSESFHEAEIREFVSAIAGKISWKINWRKNDLQLSRFKRLNQHFSHP
jgi:hypothetical protein